jgi:GT2 family glycosyltransferase
VDLSIIIVSYNTRDLLAQCMDSIETTVQRVDYEVLVVDNGSVDGSPEMVESRYPTARLIRNRDNRGFAAANNQAIHISNGRFVLLLNSDAVLLPGAVESMLRFMEHEPRAGIAGGQLLNPDGSFQSSFMDFPSLLGEVLLLTKLSRLVYPSTFPSYPPEFSQERRAVDWVSGAFLMARREAIDSVGPLDEEYFMYTEETDWCFRMHKAGWLVFYLPEARACHWIGQSSRKVPERRRSQVYRSKWLFMRKHRGRLIAAAFRAAVRVASVMKLVMWSLAALSPRTTQRQRARGHVHSYSVLLGEL